MPAISCRVAGWVAALAGRRVALLAVVALNAVHPFVHGTPLDGGALDGVLAWANAQVFAAQDE